MHGLIQYLSARVLFKRPDPKMKGKFNLCKFGLRFNSGRKSATLIKANDGIHFYQAYFMLWYRKS